MAEEEESISASHSKFSKMSNMFKKTLESGIEESLGESSSMSVPKKKEEHSPDKESYTDFEDSASNSAN